MPAHSTGAGVGRGAGLLQLTVSVSVDGSRHAAEGKLGSQSAMAGSTDELQHYVLPSGHAGRDRLRVLASAAESGTSRLLDAVGVALGMACLDVGCGGDVARLLAARVGPGGRVVGVDLDAALIGIAGSAAAGRGDRAQGHRLRRAFCLPGLP